MRDPLPATATAISFIDRINRTDLQGLSRLMTADHTLHVFDEPPIVGHDENVEAWRGYLASCPEYVIYPRRITVRGPTVAIHGCTTGSHLALPDEEEMKLSVIWLATVVDGAVAEWRLAEDDEDRRREYGLS